MNLAADNSKSPQRLGCPVAEATCHCQQRDLSLRKPANHFGTRPCSLRIDLCPKDKAPNMQASASDIKPHLIEPGLVPTFRVLITLPMLMAAVTALAGTFIPLLRLIRPAPPIHLSPALLFFGTLNSLNIIYLCWPQLPVRLGRAFLPIGLVLCTMAPLGAFVLILLDPKLPHDNVMNELFPVSFFSITPLILIGWQYDFRRVLIYCAVLLGFELGVMVLLLHWGASYAWGIIDLTIPRTTVFVATGYLVTQLVKSQRQQREALAQANAQLRQSALMQEQLAISRERNYLARELHDTLAHHMSGMVLQLEGVKLLWDNDEAKAKATLDASITTTRQGLTETRRALQALRASPLEDLGLVQAIHNLAVGAAERAGLQVEVQLPTALLSLKLTVEQVLYRIVQETLTNIERHAHAQRLSISLQHKQHLLLLRITDDGVGFKPPEVNAIEKFGLRGMQERAAMVGGALHIQSEPGRGTTVEFSLVMD